MRYANDIDEAFFSQQNVTAVVKNRTTMNNFQRVRPQHHRILFMSTPRHSRVADLRVCNQVQGATPAAAPASTKKTRNGKKVKQRNLTPSY